MKNRIRKSITYKIFLITSSLLVISSIFTYLILYIMLPNFYYEYKKESINEGINKLISNVENLSFKEATAYFDDFNSKYNVTLNVLDSNGYVVYIPSNYVVGVNDILQKKSINGMRVRVFLREKSSAMVNEVVEAQNVYTVLRNVYFSTENKTYTFYVNAPVQPISEASKVIIMFMPYILVVIFIISIMGAYIYSKIISQPLLRINKVAKQLARLDFSNKCEVKGEDEIGELSRSLNYLSCSLQKTMKELSDTNDKLLEDIRREREIEKRRREFTATISHELKTPITIIKGQIEGMLNNIGIYKNREKYLNRSLQVLNEMEQMVREVLEVSRLENEGFKPHFRRFNLADIIYNSLETLVYLANKKDITILLDISSNIVINADEKLMKKVIQNIINNAISYSNVGEKVYIKLEEGKEYSMLIVENTGIHIDEEQLKNIFKPFYRIEKSRSRNTGGSGLGLYIVKLILDNHKYKYNMFNTDIGVRFEIVF